VKGPADGTGGVQDYEEIIKRKLAIPQQKALEIA
jgi:hypothetical protein